MFVSGPSVKFQPFLDAIEGKVQKRQSRTNSADGWGEGSIKNLCYQYILFSYELCELVGNEADVAEDFHIDDEEEEDVDVLYTT